MIEASVVDAVLPYDDQVLEVFSRFDDDSARIHVGSIESTTIEAGVPLWRQAYGRPEKARRAIAARPVPSDAAQFGTTRAAPPWWP